MTRRYLGAAFLLAFNPGLAGAQIEPLPEIRVRPSLADLLYRPPPQRWIMVGSRPADPVAGGKLFDLAFGADGLPLLASIGPSLTLHFRKWDGRAWTRLNVTRPEGLLPMSVELASSRGGDIVAAVHSQNPSLDGPTGVQVFRLDGAELSSMGRPPSAVALATIEGYAITFAGEMPVFAVQAAGFVVVSRWNGSSWVRLGNALAVAGRPGLSDDQSPSLAVTADGKVVVAFSSKVGDSRAITAASWDGSRWVALGDGIPPRSTSPSLGGGNSGAPVVAFLNGSFIEVRYWNGSTWSVARQPCRPPRMGTNFGVPSLAIRHHRPLTARQRFSLIDQPMLACGIDTSASFGSRSLVARILIPGAGWERLGTGSINGGIPLARGSDLAFIMRADWRGQPWVAWTTPGEDGPNILVSTLVPVNAPNQ